VLWMRRTNSCTAERTQVDGDRPGADRGFAVLTHTMIFLHSHLAVAWTANIRVTT
jgi:hypothetical protein